MSNKFLDLDGVEILQQLVTQNIVGYHDITKLDGLVVHFIDTSWSLTTDSEALLGSPEYAQPNKSYLGLCYRGSSNIPNLVKIYYNQTASTVYLNILRFDEFDYYNGSNYPKIKCVYVNFGINQTTHMANSSSNGSREVTYLRTYAEQDPQWESSTPKSGSSKAVSSGGVYKAFTDKLAAEYSTSATYAVGDYCIKDGFLYKCNAAIDVAEAWIAAHWTQTTISAELLALVTNWAAKQDVLVSGTNIKTVNGNSLLGEGNIEIQSGLSEEQVVDLVQDMLVDGTEPQGITHQDCRIIRGSNSVRETLENLDAEFIEILIGESQDEENAVLLKDTYGRNYRIEATSENSADVYIELNELSDLSYPNNVEMRVSVAIETDTEDPQIVWGWDEYGLGDPESIDPFADKLIETGKFATHQPVLSDWVVPTPDLTVEEWFESQEYDVVKAAMELAINQTAGILGSATFYDLVGDKIVVKTTDINPDSESIEAEFYIEFNGFVPADEEPGQVYIAKVRLETDAETGDSLITVVSVESSTYVTIDEAAPMYKDLPQLDNRPLSAFDNDIGEWLEACHDSEYVKLIAVHIKQNGPWSIHDTDGTFMVADLNPEHTYDPENYQYGVLFYIYANLPADSIGDESMIIHTHPPVDIWSYSVDGLDEETGDVIFTVSHVGASRYSTIAEVQSKLATKQNTLVSGTNIKTINNQSLLGEGNITISGGGGEEPETVTLTNEELGQLGAAISTGALVSISLSDFANHPDIAEKSTVVLTDSTGAMSMFLRKATSQPAATQWYGVINDTYYLFLTLTTTGTLYAETLDQRKYLGGVETFSTSKQYSAGDRIFYDDRLYICVVPASTVGSFLAYQEWAEIQSLEDVIRVDASLGSLAAVSQIASEYDATATYDQGDLIYHRYDFFGENFFTGAIYEAKQDISVAEQWNASHWQSKTIAQVLKERLPVENEQVNDWFGLKSLLETIMEDISVDSYALTPIDQTFTFDCARASNWEEMWTLLNDNDADGLMKCICAMKGDNTDYESLPNYPILFIDVNVHGAKIDEHTYSISFLPQDVSNTPRFYVGVEQNAETGDSTIVADGNFDIFSGTIRVIYNRSGVLKDGLPFQAN